MVGLQIVSDCLKIAETEADTAVDKSAAEESRNRADMISSRSSKRLISRSPQLRHGSARRSGSVAETTTQTRQSPSVSTPL